MDPSDLRRSRKSLWKTEIRFRMKLRFESWKVYNSCLHQQMKIIQRAYWELWLVNLWLKSHSIYYCIRWKCNRRYEVCKHRLWKTVLCWRARRGIDGFRNIDLQRDNAAIKETSFGNPLKSGHDKPLYKEVSPLHPVPSWWRYTTL